MLTLTEDAFQGDAQANVVIDGNTLTARPIIVTPCGPRGRARPSPSRAFGLGAHDLAVSFLDDAYGGTPTTDRNLYMKAALVQSEKQRFEDGAIRQIKIRLVPEPVPPSTHRFKYSLVYVVQTVCVIGFDNERGKGDHRHLHDVETPYDFQSVERLLADFRALTGQERRE